MVERGELTDCYDTPELRRLAKTRFAFLPWPVAAKARLSESSGT